MYIDRCRAYMYITYIHVSRLPSDDLTRHHKTGMKFVLLLFYHPYLREDHLRNAICSPQSFQLLGQYIPELAQKLSGVNLHMLTNLKCQGWSIWEKIPSQLCEVHPTFAPFSQVLYLLCKVL